MDGLADDVAAVMDHLGLSHALLCGTLVGGMKAQALDDIRPDLVAGLMLCNKGLRIGVATAWSARI